MLLEKRAYIQRWIEWAIVRLICLVNEGAYLYLWYLRFTTGQGFMDTLRQVRIGGQDFLVVFLILVLEFWSVPYSRPNFPLK